MTNNSRFFFAILSVAAAIGIGSIFLFPYFSFKFSSVFFLQYLIALIILGIPLLMLEFSIGQYFNKNLVDAFASIKKWFSSIGWLMVFNAFVVMGFYAVILSWHLIYFFVSFGLQWKSDAKSYFFGNVLQVSEGFRNFTQLSLPVFIALIFAWLLVFFCTRKGYSSIKRNFLIILPILVILMLFFLFYSLSLDNALNGVYAFLKPKPISLISLDSWLSAFSSAVLSLGISFGVFSTFARKSEKGFVIANSFVVILFEILASISVALILFGIFGFIAKHGINFGNPAFSDYGSSFVILTQALPFFYKPTLLSLLFIIFLSLFFILGTSSLAYSIAHVLVHKFKARHVHASILVCGFGFLFGLLFVIKPGYYIMDIVIHFIYYNILIALLLETFAIGWFFDSEKISAYINQYSKIKLGSLWRFMIRYIVSLILLALIFFQVKSDIFNYHNNYPLWALLIFGVGIVAVPLVVAFLMPQKILDRKFK